MSKEPDLINAPPHYRIGGLDVNSDILRRKLTPKEYLGWLKGNVIKYTLRAGHKGDKGTEIQDVAKAEFYAQRLIEHLKGEPHPFQATITHESPKDS